MNPTEKDRRGTDRRRAPRLRTKLWVGIPEVDGEPELEECDISVFGMLLHTSRDPGSPGVVRMLRLVNADQEVAVEIMGRVVRLELRGDTDDRVIESVGFEFLAHGDHHRRQLGDFLRTVGEAELGAAAKGIRLSPFRPDRRAKPRAGVDGTPAVSSMIIETTWPIEMGEAVRAEIEIPASGRRIRLEGKALDAESIGEGEGDEVYRIEIGFAAGEAEKPRSRALDPSEMSVEEALDALFDESMVQPPEKRQRDGVHLSGTLAEVALPSLLGFIELERASGVLRLTRGSQRAAVFVCDGRIFDVDSEIPGSATDALAVLLAWSDGEFELEFQKVERDDVIGKPTTMLLLNLAREADESAR